MSIKPFANFDLKSLRQSLQKNLRETFAVQEKRLLDSVPWEKYIAVRQLEPSNFLNQKLSKKLRIAHLTDQHVGRITPMQVQKAAARLTNAQDPDLVVLTGDFVCHSNQFLDHLTEVVASFESPVFCVLGNHDHWNNADKVEKALTHAGACVLRNAHTCQTFQGQKIQIAGLDDPYTHNDDIAKTIRGLDKSLPTIGLSHIGEKAPGFWEAGIPIVFSGHTHAGQVSVANISEFIMGKLAGHKYIHGLYESQERGQKDHHVYVGAGIGSSVMPFRIGEKAQREVAIMTFRPKGS